MNTKATILLAALAGFAGGFLSRYTAPPAVHAQATSAVPEIRAQKFVVVDQTGAVLGAFGAETNGTAQIEVRDPKGHVIFGRFDVPLGWHTMNDTGNTIPKRPRLLTP